MAVFRIERTRDYTVMSNHHLKDTALSLKAKGLLSMMLSLPDEWNYTTRGLAAICKEGVDAIGGGPRGAGKAGGRRGAAGAGKGGLHRPPPASRSRRAHQRHGVHHLRKALPRCGGTARGTRTRYDPARYGFPVSGGTGYGRTIYGKARRIKY